MFTHARNYLLTAAAVTALLPAASFAQDSDYSYWNKGATAGAQPVPPQDDDANYRQPQGYGQYAPYYSRNYSAQNPVYSNMPVPRAAQPASSTNWSYDYD